MDDPVFDRASVYEEGDHVVYRASSFGYCIGALVRSRLGMTPSAPPDLMLERYQEGHDWERDVLAAGLGVDWHEVTATSQLQRFGQVVSPVQVVDGKEFPESFDVTVGPVKQVEAELRWGNKIVRVHPDAIVQHGADKHLRVCEVKFLAPERVWDMVQAGDDMVKVLGVPYAWQASIEMLATQLPMLYVVGAKKVTTAGAKREVTGISEVITMEWTEPAFNLMDVKMRVAEVEGWVARGEMPPCVVPFDWPCGFWQEHEEREREEITDEVLVHLTESYGRATSNAQAHKDEADRIKADIDARLVEVGIDGGRCGGWDIARVAARKGNVSWSSWAKAVRKKYPEVDVAEDEFRGAEVAGGVRMTKVKE